MSAAPDEPSEALKHAEALAQYGNGDEYQRPVEAAERFLRSIAHGADNVEPVGYFTSTDDGRWVEAPEGSDKSRLTKLYSAPPSQQAREPSEDAKDAINDIIRDVAELPDRSSPPGWPEAMCVMADELRVILRRYLPTVREPHPPWCSGGCCNPEEAILRKADAKCLGDPGECAYNKACMYQCQDEHPMADAIVAKATLAAGEPTCNTCGGKGVVDDGEIDCYEDGTPYANGPIKCVKDCPACCRASSAGTPHGVAAIKFKETNGT